MDFGRIQPDAIKYEVRQLSGTDIRASQQRKHGGFGRFLSGLGRILGAIAAPLSFIFPPAAIGAAAAYGVSKIGDMVQISGAKKTMEQQADQSGQLGQVYIPGLTETSMNLTRETVRVFDPTTQVRERQAQQILMTRNAMTMESAHQV